MKKTFIYMAALLTAAAVSTACYDDEPDKWAPVGENIVEGTWKRDSATPTVLAVFKSDFTSSIDTYDTEGSLVSSLDQGSYRIIGDSVLYYRTGFSNHISIDGDMLTVIYGYNAGKQTTMVYFRHNP